VSALAYGQSITDACLGWEDSKHTLQLLSDAVAARRERN
jgi:3-deoxy-7-phosphoheptulonate synthase